MNDFNWMNPYSFSTSTTSSSYQLNYKKLLDLMWEDIRITQNLEEAFKKSKTKYKKAKPDVFNPENLDIEEESI